MTTHNIAELFGITAEMIGEEIILQSGYDTYEGRLVAVDGADVTLADYTKTSPGDHYPHQSRKPVTITLTTTDQVWLDLHEDDFVTDETGAVTLPYDSAYSEF